jgi:hypothetical protein
MKITFTVQEHIKVGSWHEKLMCLVTEYLAPLPIGWYLQIKCKESTVSSVLASHLLVIYDFIESDVLKNAELHLIGVANGLHVRIQELGLGLGAKLTVFGRTEFGAIHPRFGGVSSTREFGSAVRYL